MEPQHYNSLSELQTAIFDAVNKLQQNEKSAQAIPFLRGHSRATHGLQPSLFRGHGYAPHEEDLYWEFVSRAAEQLRGYGAWENRLETAASLDSHFPSPYECSETGSIVDAILRAIEDASGDPNSSRGGAAV